MKDLEFFEEFREDNDFVKCHDEEFMIEFMNKCVVMFFLRDYGRTLYIL